MKRFAASTKHENIWHAVKALENKDKHFHWTFKFRVVDKPASWSAVKPANYISQPAWVFIYISHSAGSLWADMLADMLGD